MKNILTKTLALIVLSSIVVSSCKKKKEEQEEEDNNAAFYNEIKSTDGYTYYKNDSILPSKGPSPHGSFKVRFNSIAQAALDSTGALPKGEKFPNGSIIVKEAYSGSNISIIIPMKKDPSHSNSANGWIWAEYKPGGSTVYSISKNGKDCTGCHSAGDHRDFIKIFDLHQ